MQRATTVLVCVLGFAGMAHAQTDFVVVVHETNPASSMSRAEVAKLFLKKTKKWEGGLRIAPVDQAPGRSARKAFTKEIHGRPVPAIKGYWQKMIFSGQSTPPPELESDRQVLDYVRRSSGGIGYVSAGTSLGNGIKVLRVTDE